jgi:hypothetical protein
LGDTGIDRWMDDIKMDLEETGFEHELDLFV